MSKRSKAIKLVFNGGRMRAIYSDELACLRDIGAMSIRRASHVEPQPDGTWGADMSPVGGPMLSGYKLRSEALAAEVAYLDREVIN